MDQKNIRIILQVIVFLIPLNIYVIGDGLAAGLSWALFKVQVPFIVADAPPFLITPLKDITYVTSGLITGRSAIAIALWYAGTTLLAAALATVLWTEYTGAGSRVRNAGAPCTILAGLLFLASCIFQFGVLLHGPSGYAVPVGVPLVFGTGYWAYRTRRKPDTGEPEEPVALPETGPGQAR
jgi:hypothetical protein